MVTKVKAMTGRPPVKGYYEAIPKKLPGKTREIELLPRPMYWNGEKWQDSSDDDNFAFWGNEKPITFEPEMFPEWIMIVNEKKGKLMIMAEEPPKEE